MKHGMFLLVVTLTLAFSLPSWAAPEYSEQDATCAFADGHGMRIHYVQEPFKLRNGAVWTPGDKPVALFLDTSVSVGNTVLPVGAYGVYIVPDKKTWTLIISKSSKGGGEYDKTQDLVRIPMESGNLGHDVNLPQLAFAHEAPLQCNLRVYAGSVMAWGEIREAEHK